MNPKRLLASLAVFLAALAIVPGALGQNPGYPTNTGMPDYHSFISSDIDTVDLATGGLKIHIPLVSRKARGFDFSYSSRYESKFWQVYPYTFFDGYRTVERFVWQPSGVSWQEMSTPGGYVTYNQQDFGCTPFQDPLGDPGYARIGSNWQYVAADGTVYNFPVRSVRLFQGSTGNTCQDGPYNTPQLLTGLSDNGQMKIDISNFSSNGTFKVWFKRGMTYYSASGFTDQNGNQCCSVAQNGWALDTLGRPTRHDRYINSTTSAMDYYDSQGQTQTITFQTTNIQLATNFNTVNPYPGSCGFDQYNSTMSVLQSITLPNNLSYSFSYDDPNNPGHPNPFGEITKITLPTGGYIKYKWATIAQRDDGPSDSDCMGVMLDARVLVERRVSADGVNENVWTYSYSGSTATVTDPLGNAQVHTFGAPNNIETQVEYRQGSTTGLVRITKDWAWDTGPTVANPLVFPSPPYDPTGVYNGMSAARNPRITRATTTLLDTNQVKKTETDYGDCYSYSAFGQSLTDCPENSTQVREYDYGVGSPGALVRYATFAYLHAANATYFNAHIWNHVTEKKAFDAVGNVKAWSQFAYDTTAITGTSGVPYHDYVNYSSSSTLRGNQTQAKLWRNTDGAWLTTTNSFNDVGNLVQSVDPGGHTTSFGYTDNFTDGTNRTSQGFVTQVTYPVTGSVSHIERKQYFWYTGLVAASCGQNFPSGSACGNSYTPPQPDYTKFTYDLLGRPTLVVRGDGGQTSLSYAEGSLPITVSATTKIDATQNLVNSAVIDGLGRVKQTQLNSDPQGTVYVEATFDALGRKSTVTNPHRIGSSPTDGTASYQYDALGRVSKVIPPDGNSSSNNISTVYSGNCTTVTDQAGKARKSCGDALGRLTQVFEPNSSGSLINETDYSYDALNNLLSVVQSSSRQRTFVYNSLSQLTSVSNPESGTTNYSYDAEGNLLTRADARNIGTTHTYDALHRLTAKTYTDATPAANYVYDLSSLDSLTLQNPIGRLVKAYTTNTRTVTSYDPLGRVASEWQCAPVNCGTGWWNLAYSYNLLGAMTSYTNGMGVTFTQSINSAGQVTQLSSSLVDGTHPATLASNLSYNPAGALAQMTYGNGLVETNAYNNRLQPTQIRAYEPGPNTDKLNLTYTFTDASGNNNGNLMTWASSGSQVFNRSYTYDELNRLKTMSSPSDPSGCLGLSWNYDIWANRTDQSVTAGTCGTSHMTINALNRIADTGYGYDAAGNMTAEPGKTYAFDAENRLTSINSGAVATYVYDAGGRRVQKTSGGTTTTYIYGVGGQVAAEWVASWTVGYVYLGGQLPAQYSNNTTYFAHADHLGSTRLLTALDKSVYSSMDYLPYGELNAGGSGTTHKFTGKERDGESGLDNFGARYYASGYGRFASADLPFVDQHPRNPQSWNLYTYARNNPLGIVDPTGNSAMCEGGHGSLAYCQPMDHGEGTDAASPTSVSEADDMAPDPEGGRLRTEAQTQPTTSADVESQAQNTTTVKVNVIYDSNADLTDAQKAKFQNEILKSAVGEYGSIGVKLDVAYSPGGIGNDNTLTGTINGALNVMVSDHVPGTSSTAATQTRNGVTTSILNINTASRGDLGHEFAHVFLGHTTSKAMNYLRSISIAGEIANTAADISVGFSRLVWQSRLRNGAKPFAESTQ